jgi:hypothetical protein
MRQQWVVTYRIQSRDGVTLVEFYRGTRSECLRICDHCGGGEDDSRRTEQPWRPILGPAHSWDEFLAEGETVEIL